MGGGGGYEPRAGPWRFAGRALYQLQLVPAAEARRHVPPDLPLVQCLGYTLGGFYLARYTESPCGPFDELVVLGGLVWNAPTSCAWASRVLVNRAAARRHGAAVFGLPSRQAAFRRVPAPAPPRPGRASTSWWEQGHGPGRGGLQGRDGRDLTAAGAEAAGDALGRGGEVTVAVAERGGWLGEERSAERAAPSFALALPAARSASAPAGPRLTLRLPSFSGKTAAHPGVLQYTCELKANVRPCRSARLRFPADPRQVGACGVLRGRPLLTLAFDRLEMTVDQPTALSAAEEAARFRPRRARGLPRPA